MNTTSTRAVAMGLGFKEGLAIRGGGRSRWRWWGSFEAQLVEVAG
jgi:hypothetical protein